MISQSSSFGIYVISLPKDVERRNRFSEQFSLKNHQFSYIPAINGKALDTSFYFDKILPFFLMHGVLMSPSEVGCALSHLNALKKFLDSEYSHAIILEDDIEGNDKQLKIINKMVPILRNNYIFIPGGQEGVNTSRLYGKKIHDNLYKIPKASHPYIRRACCYVIPKETAQKILLKQNKMLVIADWWDYLLTDTNIQLYYSKLLKHPIDLSNSNIQQEREKNIRIERDYKSSFKKYLTYKLSLKFLLKEISRFKRSITFYYLRIKGYKKL